MKDARNKKITPLGDESFWHRLLEEISEGVILTNDQKTEVLYANSAALRLLGFDPENIKKVRLFDLVHPEDKKKVKAYFELLKKKKKLISERRIKTGSGAYIHVERNAKLLPDGNVISILRDVTERNDMERRKDTFISMASHELRTPLTSLSLYIDLLQNKLAEKKEENRESLELIRLAKTQLAKQTILIDDLLNLSKIRSGKLALKKSRFDLNSLVRQTADQAVSISRKIFRFDIAGEVRSKVYADRDKIHQVLMNLFSNALKYSTTSDVAKVVLAEEGSNAVVSVKDFGIGIRKEEQRKVFTRFFRVSGSQEKTFPGLGIGLYLSKKIVTEHKGKLSVKSAARRGSTFTMTLPLSKSKKS